MNTVEAIIVLLVAVLVISLVIWIAIDAKECENLCLECGYPDSRLSKIGGTCYCFNLFEVVSDLECEWRMQND